MRSRRLVAAIVVVASLAAATAAGANAIVFGEPDGTEHSNVGGLVADWNPASPGPELFCSGTLVSPTLFLTAAHCLVGWPEGTDFWVTFAPVYEDHVENPAGLVAVSDFVVHEQFGQPGGGADAYDIAIVTLASAQTATTPAELPALGLLDTYSQQELRRLVFTAVGYGIVRETIRGGPHGFLENATRMAGLQTVSSLQPTWLTLSMNPMTGNAGTCYGDSGGPHFLGGMESNLLASITVTGDAMCVATDKTYRLDTVTAQEFLSRFGLVSAP